MKGKNVTKEGLSEDMRLRLKLLPRLRRWQEEPGPGRLTIAGSSAPLPGVFLPDRSRMFLTQSGCRHVQITGADGKVKDLYLKRGEVLYCPRGTWHSVISDHSYALLSIHLGPEYMSLDWKTGRPELQLRSFSPPTLSPATRHAWMAMDAVDPSEADTPAAMHLLQALLGLMQKDLAQAGALPDKAKASYLRVREHLEEHYTTPINRDMVAQALGLHPNHISRLVRAHEDRTFSAALTQLRLEEAARLLRQTDLTVKEIAAKCGFESGNYFGKSFRQHYGISPGKFRQAG